MLLFHFLSLLGVDNNNNFFFLLTHTSRTPHQSSYTPVLNDVRIKLKGCAAKQRGEMVSNDYCVCDDDDDDGGDDSVTIKYNKISTEKRKKK